jgi:molybdopterin molybdotransferase
MPIRADRTLVTIEAARDILRDAATPIIRTETLGLVDLGGRVLAETIVAPGDVPAFSRSAMDGYAVVSEDVASASVSSPVPIRLVGAVFTGSMPARPVVRGTCMAIATGAPIPEGADAVAIVERTSRDGDYVLIMEAPARGANISPQASDLRAGQVVLEPGAWLTPSRVASLAATGRAEALVFARPRVAIVVTGTEVASAGQRLEPGQVHDVNSASLAATVREHGGEPSVGPVVPDDLSAIRTAFTKALEADLVLISGGSSVGERDYVLDIIAERGEIRFAGIAVKPGKPTIFAVIDGRPVFGMPGNPTSCLSNAYLLVAPMLRRIARLPPAIERSVAARLATRITSPRGRHQFYTVRVSEGVAYPAFKSSGDITSMANADGYVEIRADVESVEAGMTVEVKLF